MPDLVDPNLKPIGNMSREHKELLILEHLRVLKEFATMQLQQNDTLMQEIAALKKRVSSLEARNLATAN